VSTWIAGLSQAGLISERRPSFLKTSFAFELVDLQHDAGTLLGADLFPESDRDRKPRPTPGALPYTAVVSLPADLDTAWRYAATTGSAGTSAATVRDKLYPKCAFSAVVGGAAGAAQCIQAGLCRARGCAGVSR
jgi:hypothetical protein